MALVWFVFVMWVLVAIILLGSWLIEGSSWDLVIMFIMATIAFAAMGIVAYMAG